MSLTLLMSLTVPALIAGLGLLWWDEAGWPGAAAGLGLIGLSFCAWIDTVNECAGCTGGDPLILQVAWIACGVSIAAGGVGFVARSLRQDRRRS